MASIKPSSDLPTLLRRSHVQMLRIALALCGNRQSADAVVEKVLRASANISKRWETDDDAERWLMHYTVLLCRTMKQPRGNDLLLSVTTDANATAILKVIRQLPAQQREAFLLHHGEAMDLRHMATAMDCSSAAAANHLVAAVQSLKNLQLVGLGDFTAKLPGLLKQLIPPTVAMDLQVQHVLTAQRRVTWIRQAIKWICELILLAALAGFAWWIWQRIEIA